VFLSLVCDSVRSVNVSALCSESGRNKSSGS